MADSLIEFRNKENFRDHIDKVINLHFFRKLSGKTQVILSLAGPTVRTRLTHTVEVARIARKLCEKLKLNSDLAEAIALAHDLGHTPFGHVGERALKEIMCGCDTLKGKVNETDFENSGFKHNLQSFRVLCTLEAVSDNDDQWPFILWGVPAHSRMTWSRSYSGMENEILISCNHCDWVYSCFYHEKRECKRNIQAKKKEDARKKICRPSFCARLDTYKKRHEVPSEFLRPGEKKEDLLGWFIDSSRIYCSKPCYLATLYAHKRENRDAVAIFPYLFDHPFPNSFYSSQFLSYFGVRDRDFISVEAQVVSQADEIAQRQQDLEDAVSTGLISFKMAKDDVERLIGEPTIATNQKELGEKIVTFYSKHLLQTTISNIEDFSEKSRTNLNVYCLMNILFLLNGNVERRQQWIIEQLKEFQKDVDPAPIDALEEIFNMNYDRSYLYLVIYDLLENNSRLGDYDDCRAILPELTKIFSSVAISDIDADEVDLADGIDRLKTVIQDNYGKAFIYPKRDDVANYWKNMSWLNLYPFYVIYSIYNELLKANEPKEKDLFVIDDLRNIDFPTVAASYNKQEAFTIWRKILRTDANRVLANLVKFTNSKQQETLIKEFNEKQKNYILKSELVEKNDGKANYILKRLFSAFITNSHQLPDDGLEFILIALVDDSIPEAFLNDEQKTFMKILGKLEKTAIHGFVEIKQKMNKTLSGLSGDDFIDIGLSSEIKALIEKRIELKDFHLFFVTEAKDNLNRWVRSEASEDKQSLERACLRFRGILDNPILNAMPYWKSLLTRGICDFIASLTDQEAIDQYEKLYASAMELV